MAHNSPSGRKSATLWRRIDQAADTDRPQPIMMLSSGGSLVKLKGAKVPRPDQARAPRGAITGFSAAARKRLIELMASINRERMARLPLFITLTYPAIWPVSPATWKEHLDVWLKRLHRRYQRTSAVWKLEFQSRGAPHFHIMVFGPRWIDASWVARSWYQVVGSGDINHYKAGTEVRRVKSWKGVMFYASKYLAKKTLENLPELPGRFWGVSGREHLPFDLVVLPLEFGQFYRLRRLLCRWMQPGRGVIDATEKPGAPRFRPRCGGEHQGLTLFRDVARACQLLRALA